MRLVLAGWLVLVVSCTIIQSLMPNRTDYPNLETRLFKLSMSLAPARYAATHGVHYTKGKVRVVIELSSEDTMLPPGYQIEVEDRHKDYVLALVPVQQLRSLSNEPGIKFIRAPWEVIKYPGER